MAERKFLYLSSEGYHQEHATATDELTIGGLTMNGAIDMQSTNKITGLGSATTSGDALAYGQSGAQLSGLTLASDTDLVLSGGGEVTGLPTTPSGSTAATSKAYVDSVITGLGWVGPAVCRSLYGNDTVANLNGLSPTAGDAWVVTDSGTLTSGSLSVAAGDLVEFSGSVWVKLVTNSGGFVPAGTRAILAEGTIQSPYTNATDNDKIVSFSGSSNTGTDTGDAVDGTALLIEDSAHVGYWDNIGFVYEGTVPSGSWVQFTGAGAINAGTGLSYSGNTLNVGAGNGISVAADTVAAAADTTSTTTTEANAIVVGANGISVKVDNSTIEGSLQGSAGAESLRLKDAGITGAKLASNISITTTGDVTLNNPGELSVYGDITSTNGIFTGNGSGLTDLPAAASTDAVTVTAKKSTAGTINKGQPVYLVGYSSPDYTVELADCDNFSAMPAIGVASSTITDSAAGTVVMNGKITGMNTGSWSAGSALWVSSTPGTLVASRPTGSGATTLIQRIAQVVVQDGTVGIIQVFGSGLTDDPPNLTQDKLWIGNSSGFPTETSIGNGLTATPGSSIAVLSDTVAGGNIQPIGVGANGIGLDVSDIAGTASLTGLEADGSANLRIASEAAGNGLSGGSGSALSVNVGSTAGLEISGDALGIKVNSTGGLQTDANGAALKLDNVTVTTLGLSASGLKVTGLPSLFTINDAATGASVTAANLNTVTNGSPADSLHTHAAGAATEAPKVEATVTVNEAIAANNVLCWSTSTSGRVQKASSSTDALSRVVGVARTAQASPGSDCEMVAHGYLASAGLAASLGAPIYLSSTGTLTETIPSGGDRIILVGYAATAGDLWVCIRDYGKSAT